jgi:phosphonoacetate hydrolase
MNRRHFFETAAAAAFLPARPQRTFVFFIDGLGEDYIAASAMPVLRSWGRKGLRRTVKDVMPSVTNANNASVCCGCFPEEHGITANFFLDESTGKALYMESADLVLRPTLFERVARKSGTRSALLSSKKKTISLLPRGADIVLSAEEPTPEWTQRLGPAPNIYSAEINHWLLNAAEWIARNRSDIGLMYIHTTDYPMHMWPPESPLSKRHLATLDSLLGEIASAAPDAAMLLTADHGMNHKSVCWDLERACASRGLKLRAAISAEQDKYLKHHQGFGGTAWVYLESGKDENRAASIIGNLPGIERVLSRHEFAKEFRSMPSRIGELVVIGDVNTVFGNLEAESRQLPPEYRSHGCLAEAAVPLIVFNAPKAPGPDYFRYNLDLTRWMTA